MSSEMKYFVFVKSLEAKIQNFQLNLDKQLFWYKYIPCTIWGILIIKRKCFLPEVQVPVFLFVQFVVLAEF